MQNEDFSFYISDLSLELIKEIQNKFDNTLQKEYNIYHEKMYLYFIDINADDMNELVNLLILNGYKKNIYSSL